MWGKIKALFQDNKEEQVPEKPAVPELTTEELEQMFDSNEAIQKMKENATSYIKLHMASNRDLTQKNSKLGGVGYIPKTMPYPFSVDGVPLTLLAQINFAEMPKLDGYPSEGILGVYLDLFDSSLGMNLDNPANTDRFKVLYFKEFEEEGYSVEDIKQLFNAFDQSEYYPIVTREKRLVGTLETEYPFTTRDAFSENFDSDLDDFLEEQFGAYGEQMIGYVMEKYWPGGHRIAGYPLFVQEDTRIDETNKYTKLLLQIDSDAGEVPGREWKEDVVQWADSGAGKFFIPESDLRHLNFDDVHYSWDSF